MKLEGFCHKMQKEKRGKFIVLEGIDGCGKSTQIPTIAKYILEKSKYNHILFTREPYKSRETREILRQDSDPYSKARKLAELFVQDRKEHLNEIILPALKKGLYVISDRYKYSTIVYQSVQGIPLEELAEMHKGMLIPDLILIFDISVEVAKGRMSHDSRNEHKFESDRQFQEKLRHRYLELPKIFPDEKIIIIDGEKSKECVEKELIGILNKELL